MAGQSYIITLACDGALEQIEKYAPAEYAQLTPAKKNELVQAARVTAIEHATLADDLAGESQDNTELPQKHLLRKRIKGSLSIATFNMKITKKEDGTYWVELIREGESFQHARALTSADDIDWAIITQYASILVKTVVLVLSAMGISVPSGRSAIDRTVNKVFQKIKDSAENKIRMLGFITAWTAAESNAKAKSKAMFDFITCIFSSGLLWTTIKSLYKEMRPMDWLKTVVEVFTIKSASFATSGVGLIYSIASIIAAAVTFPIKIADVTELYTMQKAMTKGK